MAIKKLLALKVAILRSEIPPRLVAARIGVHPSNLSHFLAGRRPLPKEARQKLAKLLKRSFKELFA